MTYNILITESIADRAVDHLRESGECNVELAYGVSGPRPARHARRGRRLDRTKRHKRHRIHDRRRSSPSGARQSRERCRQHRRCGRHGTRYRRHECSGRQHQRSRRNGDRADAGTFRNVGAAHRALAEGRWERSTFIGSELRGRTAGIVGYGRVGRLVGALCAAMGMQVVAYDTYPGEPTASRRVDELEELLAIADIVTLQRCNRRWEAAHRCRGYRNDETGGAAGECRQGLPCGLSSVGGRARSRPPPRGSDRCV